MTATARKKICVYCDTWTQGGIETFLSETLLHMDTGDMSFHLLCAEKFGSRFDTQLEEKGIPVQAILPANGAGALEKTLKTALPLARFCREEGVEIVHLNVFHGVSLLQALVLKLYGVKRVIVHCHGAGFRESSHKKQKLLGHRLCKKLFFWAADERWAASQQAAKFLFGNRPAHIIPNGIEVPRFRFDVETRTVLRRELQVDGQQLLGCVGRLDSQKNQQFLLTLLDKLKQSGSNTKLLLIGDGEDRSALEKRVQELGLGADVVFLGHSNRVGEWMCAMDALLIPSTSEGLGIVAIEGQASGLPVLCSTGVPQEVRLSETVHFLPLSDIEQWIRAVNARFSYDRLEMNRQIHGSQYNIENSATLVRELYLRQDKRRDSLEPSKKSTALH